MKLWEGNAFSCVCLSHVTITHDALDLTVQVPLPGSDIWHLMANTGDLFKLVHLRDSTV